MAGLGCGSFGLSNNVTQNKSYIHVKLTDSAFRAIEEYLRIKNTAASPKISFRGNEGEIQIPGRSNGASKFTFSLQSIQDPDGPQGSFEFIKQFGTRALESLGPMVGKVWIQAKDDSYEKTRQSMENAKIKNQMNCVKEVKTNSGNPFVRQRPSYAKKSTLVVPPPKKEVSAELPSNNKYNHNASNSPHRTHSGGTIGNNPPAGKPPPPPPPSNVSARKTNPELVKRPLRERIIQLLAVKNYRKPEILNRLYSDGVKEKDKRQMTSVLNSVSQVKENIHHLARHLWSEVREDWPFYTDKEKEVVKRMKPQSLTPPSSDSGHSPTSALPLSPSSSLQGVKRPHEETLDPTVKRVRGPRWTSTRSSKSNDSRSEPNSDTNPESRLGFQPDNKSNSCSESKQVGSGRHHHQNERPYINGTTSPARKPSTSPISQSSPRHRLNGIHSHHSSGNHSPINGVTNGLTNGHGNPHHKMNGHIKSEPSTPNSSPDSHHGGEDTNPEYQRNYTTIVSVEQRSRYKADFNRQYQEYLELHGFIKERTRPFVNLDERLKNETLGSDEYNVQYTTRRPNVDDCCPARPLHASTIPVQFFFSLLLLLL
ncbi:RNA polymerase II elongation factor ELL2 isoform X2 [Panulirus ornatus]|uniref:RNA polymerase II elongation factor ELL2 isoform X2 n=1 Tax=Panulirus ornatus TaxID=150431 RepID=UPI003A85BA45